MAPFEKWFLSSSKESLKNYEVMIGGMTEMIKRHYGKLQTPYTHINVNDLTNLVNRSVYFSEHEQPLEDLFDDVQALVMDHSLHISHPGAMAHLHCPPVIPALAAEVMISALNQSMDSWDQSPAATYIENQVINELTKQIGYSSSSSGVFTSGGTQSNYMGLLLARNEYCHSEFSIDVSEEGLPFEAKKLRVFCSEKAHFTVQQSAAQLGLGMNAVVSVKCNERYEMDIENLEEAIRKVKEQGNLPFAIVATAGTTDFGSVDPLREISKLAKKEGLWLHADAAYGGALLFSHKYRERLKALERADSITMDFHKWFYQPVSCGAFLLKNQDMFKHIQLHADYLNPEEDEHVHLVDRSIQTTKRFDALKLWLTFRAVGTNEYGKMVDHTVETAQQTAGYLQKQRNIAVLNDPYMNAVVFRYVPEVLYADHQKQLHYENNLNQRIQEQLYEQGTFIMAKTKHKAQAYLKLTMLNPMITFDSVATHLEEVVALGKQLEKKEEQLRERSVIG
ncbi:pyridoxal phosphate-dependent decarboxylase family protein [Priestia aryabhattai]|uniref:pyridoxal phosphate-dependent decarboxylase family protein n=1 Tax=Priestia megaterium TaxID=1404 RepID=UPI0039B86CF3